MPEHLSVLIVDDSQDDALLMVLALRRTGFDVTMRRVDTADSMALALEDTRWDLILADYRMPRFSGTLALELYLRAGLDAPFILVSATVGEETAVDLMKAGAHDFVLKHNLGRLGAVVVRELRDAEVRRRRAWAEAALEILADAGKLVAELPDVASIVQRAAGIPVPRIADWCIVYSRDRSSLTDVSATAVGPTIDGAPLAELARSYPPVFNTGDLWFDAALRTRKPVLVSTVGDDELARIARDETHLRLLRAVAPRSVMLIPQVARDHVVGLLVLASQHPGRYNDADLGLAEEIGQRIAVVLENARLTRDKDEFISTAIHEIRTPIAVIKMAVQLMEQLPPAQREHRLDELFRRLDRQCDRLDRMVTHVLEVARLDLKRWVLNRRPTDLTMLIERVVGEMRDASPRHTLSIRRNDAVTVSADVDRLEQVLTNLLGNAIRYSPAGGTIEIESRRSDGNVSVSVTDHGIGIPRDKQDRIFERFYRAHAGTAYDHASSLGVGLYLSNEIVKSHGGRMWFESQEGKGSTFGFTVPAEQAP